MHLKLNFVEIKRNNEDFNFIQKLSNFISYSQYFEDLILFCIFYDVKNGFYVDIGANDPNICSVTKAFYLRGWHGINVEPLTEKYQALAKQRRKDINLKIAIAQIEGNQTFYPFGTHSTLNEQHVYWKNKNKLNVIVDTMANICKKYIPKNEVIQFCKIDVEGGEKNVLLGNDFEKYRPKIFCIESKKQKMPNHNLWEYILLKNDYSFAFQYKVNRYYIDNRISDLRQRFLLAKNILEIFKKKTKKK